MVTPLAPFSLIPSIIGLIWECQEAVDATRRVQKGDFKDLFDTIQSLRGPLGEYKELAARGELSAALIGPLATLEKHLKQARDMLKKFDRMSVAYRFICHRNIAADLRSIKTAISSDLEVHKFATGAVQEERARQTVREIQELKEMVRRLQIDTGSDSSASSCTTPLRSRASFLNEFGSEELQHERDVLPAEITALRQAGDTESADTLTRFLDRLEVARDGTPIASAPTMPQSWDCDSTSSWVCHSPYAEASDSEGRGRVGGLEFREGPNEGEFSVASELVETDWLDPNRWGVGAPTAANCTRQLGGRRTGKESGRRDATAFSRKDDSNERRKRPGGFVDRQMQTGYQASWQSVETVEGIVCQGYSTGSSGGQIDMLDAARWGLAVPSHGSFT